MSDIRKPIAILYEHPTWFEPLFDELERRGLPYRRLDLREHTFDPDEAAPECSLLYNRMSPSAHLRGLPGAVEHTRAYLAHVERRGVRVVNGLRAFDVETSKARQLSLLDELGVAYPASRVVHRPGQIVEAASALRFPVVVKPNLGGSGAGIRRFETRAELREAVDGGGVELGPDGTGLVQEHVPARDGHIVRVEVLGGEFLYGIGVRASTGCYDLCPADLEEGPGADDGSPAVESHRPPARIRSQVERITAAAEIEVGGVEYLVDDRDGTVRFYDINANSNFVANAEKVVGLDPFARLVDFLVREATADGERKPTARRPLATGEGVR